MRHLAHRLALTLFAIGLLAVPAATYALDAPPKPKDSPIVDQANVLTPEQEVQLAATLKAERDKTGNQIGILTIKSLEGDALEDYSIKVARGWGIGSKERDSGVLLLAVIDDRKLRIEVGYGLEGSLTDARSSRIIRDRIAPEFRKGRYYEGLNSGVQGIHAAIAGEVDPNLKSDNPSEDKGFSFPLELIFFALFIIPSWLGSILARTKSWWAGGVIGAIAGAIIGAFLGFLYAGLIAIGALTLLGLLLDKAVSSNYHNRRSNGYAPSWWAGGTTLGGENKDLFGGFGGGDFGGGGSSGDW